MATNRRALLVGAAALAAAGGAHAAGARKGRHKAPVKIAAKAPAAPAAPPPPTPGLLPDDMVLGKASAPVTVIEYASASCPHCARWALESFPDFKKRFIDTGKVRFIFREFITPPEGLAIAGFLIARKAGPDHYFQVVHDVFAAQPEFYAKAPTATPIDILKRIGRANGLTDEDVDTALSDQAAVDAIYARVQGYATTDHVDSTPTFLVGDQRIVGENASAQLAVAIEKARKQRGKS